MHLLVALLLNALAFWIADLIVPGMGVENFTTAVLAAIVLGLVNTFLKPVLVFLTLPLNVLTLGLFTFVINAIILWLVAAIVPGLTIAGPLAAILGAVVLSVVSTILAMLAKDLKVEGKGK